MSRASWMSSLSSVAIDHGSSTSHSRYVRVTVYSADDGCMTLSRSSCFIATFSVSGGILAAVIFSRKSSRSPPLSSISPSSSLMALSCWRSTYSRWLRPISSWTWLLIFSRTLSTSCWRERNCSTLRRRVLRSNVSSTSCFSSTCTSRFDVMRSASCPGSVTLSTSALASLGSSGMSLMTRFATSLRFMTSASSSTSVTGRSGSGCTRAVMNGSWLLMSTEADARDALQDDREVVLRELDDLEDARRAPDHVEVGRPRILGARVALGHDADDRAAPSRWPPRRASPTSCGPRRWG